jgi:hypothetical protein
MRLPFISRRRLDEAEAQNQRLATRIQLLEGASSAEMRATVRNMRRRDRALKACRRYRAEAAAQRRVIRRLTDQLLDATGYQGEPLLPAARVVLGIEGAKGADA